ncbi:MAG: hypothetical protein HYV52_00280 [Parcubacteria group bacterium]|nr:hypothetical protein [Parcubacteria group bacterium]
MSNWYSNVENFKKVNGYEIDGIWYPRVTAITKIKANPALYKWYADSASFSDAEKAKKTSASEGSLLHEVVESILSMPQGADVEKIQEIPASVRPAVEKFIEFKNQNKITPLSIEERAVSKKHGYAGTIDALVELNGQIGVLDIKTSSGIWRDYGLQTAAYIEALNEKHFPLIKNRWILRLDQLKYCLSCGAKMREKGGVKKIKGGEKDCPHLWDDLKGELEIQLLSDFQEDIKAFLAAKALWEWENSYWLKQII